MLGSDFEIMNVGFAYILFIVDFSFFLPATFTFGFGQEVLVIGASQINGVKMQFYSRSIHCPECQFGRDNKYSI